MGATGLLRVDYKARFTPAVKVGWRLDRKHWGRGFAVEAATKELQFGFDDLRLPEIVANTVLANANSRKVMKRLGMTRAARKTTTTRWLQRAARRGGRFSTGCLVACGWTAHR